MTVARQQLPILTPRQEQILELIGEGMTNREIGVRLGVTEKTIKNSVTGLLASLNVQRRSQAAVYSVLRRLPAGLSPTGQIPTGQPSVTTAAPPMRRAHPFPAADGTHGDSGRRSDQNSLTARSASTIPVP